MNIKAIFQIITIVGKLGALKNPKTTIIGIIAAILAVVYDHMLRGTTDWLTMAVAVIPVVWGVLSKDADVSSGGEQKRITISTIAIPNTDFNKDTSMEGLDGGKQK